MLLLLGVEGQVVLPSRDNGGATILQAVVQLTGTSGDCRSGALVHTVPRKPQEGKRGGGSYLDRQPG